MQELTWSGGFTIEAQLEKLDLSNGSFNMISRPWTSNLGGNLANNPTVYNGRFYFKWTNIDPGWYTLKIRAKNSSGAVVKEKQISRVGVGDVFLIAGQSNAEGISNTGGYNLASDPQKAVQSFSYWDAVNTMYGAFDGQSVLPSSCVVTQLTKDSQVAPTGENAWCWGVLGYLIALNQQVPVLFMNAAQGGTPSAAWRKGAELINNPATPIDNNKIPWISPAYYTPRGQPYINLKNALNSFANTFGVRAVLWHQGETDTAFRNSTSYDIGNYQVNLQSVIDNSRTHFNGANLGWVVSSVSLNKASGTIPEEVHPPVNSAQISIGGQNGKYFKGPATDNIGLPRLNESPTFVHFKNENLDELAVAWYNALSTSSDNVFNNGNTDVSPYVAKSLMNLTVAANGNNFTITPQNTTLPGKNWGSWSINYSAQENAGNSSLTASSRTLYRAYFSDSQGNTHLSIPFRKIGIYPTFPGGGIFFKNEAPLDVIAYPNPSRSEEINLKIENLGKEYSIDLLAETGELIDSYTEENNKESETVLKLSTAVFPKAGLYYYRITTNGTVITKRILIKK